MPWSTQVVVANLVIIEGENDGLFVYNGPAAAGNLVASVSVTDGEDRFGNPVWNGFTVYTGNGHTDLFLSLRTNGLYFGLNENGPGGTGALAAEAPVTLRILRLLVATDPNSETDDESWHTFALASGWSVGTDSNGNNYPPAYQLLPDGTVAIRGCLVTPSSGTVTGTPFNSTALISPYVPASGANIPTATVTQATGAHTGTVEIHPNGNVELQGAFTTSLNIRLDCTIRVI